MVGMRGGGCYLLACLLPYLLNRPTLRADHTADPLLWTADRRFRSEGMSRGRHRVTLGRLALHLLHDLAHELARELHLRVGAREHHGLHLRDLVLNVRVDVDMAARACADVLDDAASLANHARHRLDGEHLGHLHPGRAARGGRVAGGRPCVASLRRRRVRARPAHGEPSRSRSVQTLVDQRFRSLDLIRKALDRDWLAVGPGLTFVLNVNACPRAFSGHLDLAAVWPDDTADLRAWNEHPLQVASWRKRRLSAVPSAARSTDVHRLVDLRRGHAWQGQQTGGSVRAWR